MTKVLTLNDAMAQIEELRQKVEELAVSGEVEQPKPTPKTSRERFDQWRYANYAYEDIDTSPWLAWQEAERQALAAKPDLPEPVREPLEWGREYFTPRITRRDWVVSYAWSGNETDWLLLERNQIFLTAEDAITVAKHRAGEVAE